MRGRHLTRATAFQPVEQGGRRLGQLAASPFLISSLALPPFGSLLPC